MSERDKLDRVRRMVTKACPDCDQQIPVACKSCTCGHAFTSRKQLQQQLANQAHPDGIKRRRTERIRRQKPKFYTAPREVPANPVKRRRRTTSETTGTSTDDQEKKKKRGKPGPKPGVSKVKKEEDDTGGTNGERSERRERQQQQEEEDLFANISAEKALQYSVILAELNRKYSAQNFKPS